MVVKSMNGTAKAQENLRENKSDTQGGVAMTGNRKEKRMDVLSTIQMVVGLACGTRAPGNIYCCSSPDGVGLWQQSIGGEYWLPADSESGLRDRAKSKARKRDGRPAVCVLATES